MESNTTGECNVSVDAGTRVSSPSPQKTRKGIHECKQCNAHINITCAYRVSMSQCWKNREDEHIMDFCDPICATRYNRMIGIRHTASILKRWPAYERFYREKQHITDAKELASLVKKQVMAESYLGYANECQQTMTNTIVGNLFKKTVVTEKATLA